MTEVLKPLGKLSIEGDMAVIRLPLSELHGLRVSLEPCPCRATKSNATAEIRARLAKSLGMLANVAERKRRP